MPKASVKIMRSYDYCHFEVCLGTDEDMSLVNIDIMRKNAARLVDKAVTQYMKAKERASLRSRGPAQAAAFERDCLAIAQKSENDRTPNEMAMLKQYRDEAWRDQFLYEYDYENEADDDRSRW